MSEIEETSMDKRNTPSRQLTLPSPKSGNEVGGSIGKFSGAYQKRDFSCTNPGSNESLQSKKYPQTRERVSVKENGGNVRKLSDSNRKWGYGHGGSVSNESALSNKFPQPRERAYDKRSFLGSYGGSPERGRNGSSAKGNMNAAIQNQGYRSWKETTYPRNSIKARYSKEQFLQANCQFVVRENGNYAVHANNPDMLVDWDLIEQVRIFDHEVPSCPICLYPPKAAKITRCGHSYCWPCMLHYLSLFDEGYVNCPICYGRVREKDLKSVVALQTTRYSIGQELTMRLMKKSRGQTLVSPRTIWNSEHHVPFGVTDMRNNSYAKLLIADQEYVERILNSEREELLFLYHEDNPDTLEGSFITAAMKSLEERALALRCQELLIKEQELDARLQRFLLKDSSTEESEVFTKSEAAKPSKKYASAFSDEEEQELDESTPNPSLNSVNNNVIDTEKKDNNALDTEKKDNNAIDTEKDNNAIDTEKKDNETFVADNSFLLAVSEASEGEKKEESSESIVETLISQEPKELRQKKRRETSDATYFYQAVDGQHVYLQGLNISCLKAQYGDMSRCPDELTAKIVNLERIFMDEELRKKYRWLNHLPLTCEFIMAELDLKPPLVSQDILDLYADEISKRQKDRERKQQYDNKRTQRIQKEESRKMGIDPNSRIVRSDFRKGAHPSNISSIDAAFASMTSVGQTSLVESLPTLQDPAAVAEFRETQSTTAGEASRNSCSSEENCLQTVPSFAQMLKMGSLKPTHGTPERSSEAHSDKGGVKWSDSDGEECARAPEYRNVFMLDIEQRLAELDCAGNTEAAEAGGNGGKKKEKSTDCDSALIPLLCVHG